MFPFLLTYPSIIALFIVNKANSVQAVHDIILCNPLIRILPSLSRQSDNFSRLPEV